MSSEHSSSNQKSKTYGFFFLLTSASMIHKEGTPPSVYPITLEDQILKTDAVHSLQMLPSYCVTQSVPQDAWSGS